MTKRMHVLALVAASLAVVAVVVVSVVLVAGSSGGPSGSHPRQPLHLATTGRDAVAATAPSPGAGAYRLAGTLPAGRPEDAPVWTLQDGAADAEVLRRLAAALHAGQLVQDGAGWRAGGLRVSGDQGQAWSWSTCGDDVTVSSGPDGAVTTCAGTATAAPGSVSGSVGSSGAGGSAGSTGSSALPAPDATAVPVPVPDATAVPVPVPDATAVPAPAPISEAVVRAAAEPLRTALALGRPAVTTSPYGGTASWTPRVGDLPTTGLTTEIQVDRAGEVQSAHGWLAAATRGERYPLVTARAAFDALPVPPQMLMLCPVGPDGKGCVTPPPAEVTGAHLGLSLQELADGGRLLVPSWLFDVKGSTEPLAAVAVEPRWLVSGTPSASAPPPGTVQPGLPESAPPAPAPLS
jgi:hypothetical protein